MGRILIAFVVGWVVGRLLGVVAFRPPGRLSALADTPQGFVAIAVTLLAYGTTELLQGYGFLAVFVAAVVLRGTERTHEFHADLHGFAEQIENLLVVGLLILFGGALVAGIFDGLTWQGAVVALLVVFVGADDLWAIVAMAMVDRAHRRRPPDRDEPREGTTSTHVRLTGEGR